MRTVRSFAQLLQREFGGNLKGDGAEYLRFIGGGVERMQTLINDLLTYSRVGSQGRRFARPTATRFVPEFWRICRLPSKPIKPR